MMGDVERQVYQQNEGIYRWNHLLSYVSFISIAWFASPSSVTYLYHNMAPSTHPGRPWCHSGYSCNALNRRPWVCRPWSSQDRSRSRHRPLGICRLASWRRRWEGCSRSDSSLHPPAPTSPPSHGAPGHEGYLWEKRENVIQLFIMFFKNVFIFHYFHTRDYV